MVAVKFGEEFFKVVGMEQVAEKKLERRDNFLKGLRSECISVQSREIFIGLVSC